MKQGGDLCAELKALLLPGRTRLAVRRPRRLCTAAAAAASGVGGRLGVGGGGVGPAECGLEELELGLEGPAAGLGGGTPVEVGAQGGGGGVTVETKSGGMICEFVLG